jgi:hypothetical protein
MMKKKEEIISVSLDYSDPLVPLELKKKKEKRRRYQAYMTLDYFLGMVSYFDFFDSESFYASTQAKYYGQFWKKTIVPSEFLFLCFFQLDSSFSKLLNKYELNEETTGNLVVFANPPASLPFFRERFSFLFKGVDKFKFFSNSIIPSLFLKDFSFNTSITYSRELNLLFQKASENAIERFKTPLISREVLFITLIEERYMRSRLAAILEELMPSYENWYLLRYQLIKRLYKKEIALRNDINKNQKYFGYLFATQLTNSQFLNLVKNKYIDSRVGIFRKILITKILKQNCFKDLLEETNNSIQVSNSRF